VKGFLDDRHTHKKKGLKVFGEKCSQNNDASSLENNNLNNIRLKLEFSCENSKENTFDVRIILLVTRVIRLRD